VEAGDSSPISQIAMDTSFVKQNLKENWCSMIKNVAIIVRKIDFRHAMLLHHKRGQDYLHIIELDFFFMFTICRSLTICFISVIVTLIE